MKRTITLWGPNSNKRPLPRATLDDRCPQCAGIIIYDERNRRDECEACGQPIAARKAPKLPSTLYD